MATGFRRSDGTDLDQLFMAGGTGVAGYPFTFQAYSVGAKQPATGFRRSDGVDLADLFQHISVPLGAIVNPLTYNDGYYSDAEEFSAQTTARHFSDGTWDIFANGAGAALATGNWWSAGSTPGIGNSKYIKWTRTSIVQSTGTGSFSADQTTYLLLDQTRGPYAHAQTNTSTSSVRDAWYTIYLSADGVNAASTSTVRLRAYSPRYIDI